MHTAKKKKKKKKKNVKINFDIFFFFFFFFNFCYNNYHLWSYLLVTPNKKNFYAYIYIHLQSLILVFIFCIHILWILWNDLANNKHKKLVKEEYMEIILRFYFFVSNKNISCWHSEAPTPGTSLMNTHNIHFYRDTVEPRWLEHRWLVYHG